MLNVLARTVLMSLVLIGTARIAVATEINPSIFHGSTPASIVGGCSNVAGWHDRQGGGLPWWTFKSGCSLPSGGNLSSYGGDNAQWSFSTSASGIYTIMVWIPNPTSALCNTVTVANTATAVTYRLLRSDGSTTDVVVNQQANVGKWVTIFDSVKLGVGSHKVILFDNQQGTTCCYSCTGTSIKLFADHLDYSADCTDECAEGATKCSGTANYEKCTVVGSGCTTWLQWGCGTGMKCTGSGQCVPSCTSTCSAGQKECYGGGVRTCVSDGQGCYQWGTATPCTDGNPCTADSCSGGTCSFPPTSGSCSDYDSCTQNDSCSGGTCLGGPPKVCNDGNPCTTDTCAGGSCQYVNISAPCNDANACTEGDWCSAGSCQGIPKICDDGNACTDDTCIGGSCQQWLNANPCSDNDQCTVGDTCNGGWCAAGPPKSCDDGNPCTTDACHGGSCTNVANAKVCSDGDPCTQGDTCSGGSCVGGPPLKCDDGNPCTTDTCQGGSCAHVPNALPCNDGSACTVSDACVAGACQGKAPLPCDDGNPCTQDGCNPASGCTHASLTSPCEDGNPCTKGDQCLGGACASGPAVVCNDGNPCTADSCAAGTCQYVSHSVPCDDANPCTEGDWCTGGSCQGVTKACDDGNECTDDACIGGVCKNSANAHPCSDDDLCTVSDACGNGACVSGAPKVCNDGNPCTDDLCQGGACIQTVNTKPCNDGNPCTIGDMCAGSLCGGGPPMACDDGNPCTTDSCQGGACAYVANTLPCTDGSLCTTGDTCQSGSCMGKALLICDDGNPCTHDTCNALSGCSHDDNTLPCSDGDACTMGHHCASGACVGGVAIDCDDGVGCTIDACEPQLGCTHVAVSTLCDDGVDCTVDACSPTAGCSQTPSDTACTDGDVCTTDACVAGKGCAHTSADLPCDDGNPCTTDVCKSAVGCAHVDNAAPCDDGNPCTAGDTCADGSCAGGPAVPCDDANPCTQDACTAPGGCVHTPVAMVCDDHDACTMVDACVQGACVGSADLPCSDGNVCTADACDALLGCVHPELDGVACSDKDPCTVNDVCGSGACLPGATNPCSDAIQCTADICHPGQGCLHIPEDTLCDDGVSCTIDACSTSAGCVATPSNGACASLGACDAPTCDAVDGCQHHAAPDQCMAGDQCAVATCDATYTCHIAPKDCSDGNPCTTDACDPQTGSCVSQAATTCCNADSECPLATGCAQTFCLQHQCVTIAGCPAGESCAFGDCYKSCAPPKDSTKCGATSNTLYTCLTDANVSVWVPKECAGGSLCAYDSDLQTNHCCTPDCAGRECGKPSSCMVDCGHCKVGFFCGGPTADKGKTIIGPDAWRCVPACTAIAATVPPVEPAWTTFIPECGPTPEGTVNLESCGGCSGHDECNAGRCWSPCDEKGTTAVGKCDAEVATWCEEGKPKSMDCTAGLGYCCAPGDKGNAIDHVTCCSCATECTVKGWTCGVNSCGEACGEPDACNEAQGYQCQAHQCACASPMCAATEPGTTEAIATEAHGAELSPPSFGADASGWGQPKAKPTMAAAGSSTEGCAVMTNRSNRGPGTTFAFAALLVCLIVASFRISGSRQDRVSKTDG